MAETALIRSTAKTEATIVELARRDSGLCTAPRSTTLLALIQVVQEFARSDDEVVAVIASLLRSRQLVLCGTFAGCDLSNLAA